MILDGLCKQKHVLVGENPDKSSINGPWLAQLSEKAGGYLRSIDGPFRYLKEIGGILDDTEHVRRLCKG